MFSLVPIVVDLWGARFQLNLLDMVEGARAYEVR